MNPFPFFLMPASAVVPTVLPSGSAGAACLLLLALVLLTLGGFNVPARRVNYGWLGMALWCLVILLGYATPFLHPR